MSERSIYSFVVACAVLAAPVQAQELDQLRRHEAELTERLGRLRAEAAASNERRFAGQTWQVVSSGPLHLALPAEIVAGDEDRSRALLGSQRTRYGSMVDALLTDTLYVGVEDASGTTRTGPRMAWWRLGSIRGEREILRDGSDDSEWIPSIVGIALQGWAEGLLDMRLRAWLGALDGRTTVAALRDPLVRDLVSSPSSRARRCFNGAADECRLLLELDEGTTPLLAAYDAGDLPALFDRMELSVEIPGRANCIGKRDPAACAELVRRGVVVPPHPVSFRARQSLFAYALAAGGDGAWLRLHRSQGLSLAAQLSAAAGRPVDSLLVSWQRDLREGRRATTAGLAPSLLLALAWSVVTTLFFAWRYRWRHV